MFLLNLIVISGALLQIVSAKNFRQDMNMIKELELMEEELESQIEDLLNLIRQAVDNYKASVLVLREGGREIILRFKGKKKSNEEIKKNITNARIIHSLILEVKIGKEKILQRLIEWVNGLSLCSGVNMIYVVEDGKSSDENGQKCDANTNLNIISDGFFTITNNATNVPEDQDALSVIDYRQVENKDVQYKGSVILEKGFDISEFRGKMERVVKMVNSNDQTRVVSVFEVASKPLIYNNKKHSLI